MPRLYRQKTGSEAREQISRGVDIIADQVGSTLGPNGALVAIRMVNPNSPTGHTTILTKDGVSVAKAVYGDQAGENIGIDIIRESALLTLKNAGDGTTTTVIIAKHIYEQVCLVLGHGPEGLVVEPQSSNVVKSEVLAALQNYVDNLKTVATPVDRNSDDLHKIAVVSTNGDNEIADLIVEAFKAVDYVGHVSYEQGEHNHVEVVPGCRAAMHMISPAMITNHAEGTAEYNDPIICIHEDITSSAEGVQKLVALGRANMATHKKYSPVVYISKGIDGSTTGALIGNHMTWHKTGGSEGLPIVGMEYRISREVMEDIACACDTQMFGAQTGRKVDNAGKDLFGTCAKIVVSRDHATFYFNQGEKINERVAVLEAELQRETDSDRRADLKERISNLTVGVAIIKVKSASQTEAGEKFDRIDDAVRAVQCAIEEGWVCGGGIGYIDAMPKTWGETMGGRILAKAVAAPAMIIAGGEVDGKKAEYLQNGVIDPAKVVRLAMINGVTAGLHLALTGGFLSNSEV